MIFSFVKSKCKSLLPIINCFHIVLQECGPSGVPNGQWMKVPRPGKNLVIFPSVNFRCYDCVTSSPTMNILVLLRSQCRCCRILWKKHQRYNDEHHAHQCVFFVCMYLLLLSMCVLSMCLPGYGAAAAPSGYGSKGEVCFSVDENLSHSHSKC